MIPGVTLPMIVFVAILLGVAAVVLGVALSHRKLEPDVWLMISATVYVTGLVLGPLLTNFSSPTVESWWRLLAVRVAWVGAGTLFTVIMVFTFAVQGRSASSPVVWGLAALFIALGAWSASNPVRDLLEGPLTLSGANSLEVTKTSGRRASIWASLELKDPSGQPVSLDFSGWAANTAVDALADCPTGKPVTVVVLRHVERVLDAKCDG